MSPADPRKAGRACIFLDEIQMVDQFQKAVNSLLLRENVDIYLIGSNAKKLSGELAALLSGRYLEITMLPLSFHEYYEIVGGDKRTAFTKHYRASGFPYLASIDAPIAHREYGAVEKDETGDTVDR